MLGIKILKNVYIIGAGLAGLSASIHGITKKLKINLFESSNLVGGRCRSYYEKKLDQAINSLRDKFGRNIINHGKNYE